MEDAWRRDYVDEQFLINHNNTQGTVDWHRELAANASGYRLPYELGETSSLSVRITTSDPLIGISRRLAVHG